LMFRFYRFLLF